MGDWTRIAGDRKKSGKNAPRVPVVRQPSQAELVRPAAIATNGH